MTRESAQRGNQVLKHPDPPRKIKQARETTGHRTATAGPADRTGMAQTEQRSRDNDIPDNIAANQICKRNNTQTSIITTGLTRKKLTEANPKNHTAHGSGGGQGQYAAGGRQENPRVRESRNWEDGALPEAQRDRTRRRYRT